jgi:hypothetical protein
MPAQVDVYRPTKSKNRQYCTKQGGFSHSHTTWSLERAQSLIAAIYIKPSQIGVARGIENSQPILGEIAGVHLTRSGWRVFLGVLT